MRYSQNRAARPCRAATLECFGPCCCQSPGEKPFGSCMIWTLACPRIDLHVSEAPPVAAGFRNCDVMWSAARRRVRCGDRARAHQQRLQLCTDGCQDGLLQTSSLRKEFQVSLSGKGSQTPLGCKRDLFWSGPALKAPWSVNRRYTNWESFAVAHHRLTSVRSLQQLSQQRVTALPHGSPPPGWFSEYHLWWSPSGAVP